jgi:hypothetical protein
MSITKSQVEDAAAAYLRHMFGEDFSGGSIGDNHLEAMRAALAAAQAGATEWQPIETAPKDCVIETRGEAGPYGVTTWTGRARWGLPINWHKNDATWLSPDGEAVLSIAGYKPTHWRALQPPAPAESEYNPDLVKQILNLIGLFLATCSLIVRFKTGLVA